MPLRIRTGGGGGIGSGRSFGGDGDASIRIAVGRRTTLLDLEQDWVLTHEFVHLALPDLPREQLWMEEGLATYVEPIARARRGRLNIAELWSGLVEGIPKGVAHVGGPGLDETDAWGSTYWGGALFWLMATWRSANAPETAAGSRTRLLASPKRAATRRCTGRSRACSRSPTLLSVFRALGALYEKMGPRPMPTDLQAYWQRLGVIERAQDVSFDDTAPLAAIRLAITARIPAPAVPPE